MDTLIIWIIAIAALLAARRERHVVGRGLARPDARRPPPLKTATTRDRRRTTCIC